MKLYELSHEYQQLLDDVFQLTDTGELDTVAVEQLNTLKDAIEVKAIAVSSYIANLRAEIHAVGEARKAMQDREKRLNNRIEYLEDYLLSNMENCGITEISSSPYFTIKIRKCPPSVSVIDPLLLPLAYISEKITTSPNKIKIANDIRAGKMVPGATLLSKNKIEIK